MKYSAGKKHHGEQRSPGHAVFLPSADGSQQATRRRHSKLFEQLLIQANAMRDPSGTSKNGGKTSLGHLGSAHRDTHPIDALITQSKYSLPICEDDGPNVFHWPVIKD